MKAKISRPSQESDLSLRLLLSKVMGDCQKDRRQIAAELSEKTGRAITVSMLNDYTATGKTTARFPAAYVRGFCEVTSDDSIQRFLLGSRLLDLIETGERELAVLQNRSAKDLALKRLLDQENQGRGQKERNGESPAKL